MNSERQVIAVDVMGGDEGISSVIRGIELAIKLFPNEIGGLVLVGDEATIKEHILHRNSVFHSVDLEIYHASQAIDMAEKPMHALRNKKDSSMFRAIELLKENHVTGVLSCGNTGCLVAGGTLKLGVMPGIDRPALATVIPAPTNHFVLIDVGANPTTSAKSLVHNALLGTLYYKAAIDPQKDPRVGLLTIGTEEGKGSETICTAHGMLKKINGEIRYCGLIEGFQLFSNEIDVVICDGFVGNILLKTIESLAETIKNYVKSEMRKNPLRMLGAFLAGGAFRAMKRDLTADKYGGAPLLGLNGVVIKSHGSSSVEAIAHALRLTFRLSKMSGEHFLNNTIEKVNLLIE
ncbi:MAG: phosphate acyltransferase PlsX [Puniceicoccales bacterium]|jgi:glycerol-3-phosphate acyltransferase PlsX|nr:phosphate acyltransferase PlsX [Puniceicoccales bacterium]